MYGVSGESLTDLIERSGSEIGGSGRGVIGAAGAVGITRGLGDICDCSAARRPESDLGAFMTAAAFVSSRALDMISGDLTVLNVEVEENGEPRCRRLSLGCG